MEYFAHKNSCGELQTVICHLKNVAAIASDFSAEIFKPIAHETGMLHDIGKYSAAFQRRLQGSAERFEHSTCGALECVRYAPNPRKRIEQYFIAYMMAYCIAGHHTGLPDGGTAADDPDNDNTLQSRLKRKDRYYGSATSYSAYEDEVTVNIPCAEAVTDELICSANDNTEFIEKYAFFTRYIFSCLTDADFLDTERFCMSSNIDRHLSADFSEVQKRLAAKFSTFTADTPLKQARTRLQAQALENTGVSDGISILNMPTGSGKTLCSLNLALKKLLDSKGSKKRIIYVIPYTSIIEQTAEQFEEIFGDCCDILQHHSNYCVDDGNSDFETAQKLRLASENWDSPFVITTSVRFFESLYHYRGSALRRLHNVGDSIIIFDEVHLLPTEMLQPCLRAIGYITKYLNSEAILLSATMPDYTALFSEILPGRHVHELLPDKSDFECFKKCQYISLGKTDLESVAEKTTQYTSSLIVVNKKRTAREVYEMLSGEKYHLSTYMTPSHRSYVIRNIRQALSENRRVTVVSTSLIEAGVDLDFEAVFRQCAGLDNILQTGGRCNREGRRDSGDVYIFETDERLPRNLQLPANIVKGLLRQYEDISSLQCIEEYYRRLFGRNKEKILENSIAKFDGKTQSLHSIPFRSYAESFEFIKDNTVGIVIPHCSEAEELVDRLKSGDRSVLRRLQKYTVALRRHEFDSALKYGIISDFGTGIFILSDTNCYSMETGFDTDRPNDIIL